MNFTLSLSIENFKQIWLLVKVAEYVFPKQLGVKRKINKEDNTNNL